MKSIIAIGLVCCLFCSPFAIGETVQLQQRSQKQFQLQQRLRQTSLSDTQSIKKTAQWCASNGLIHEATKLYRHALWLNPTDDVAYDRLIRLVVTHGVADSKPQAKQLLREFGSQFHIYETDHFLIVHDNPKSWAASRARMLELTRKRFLTVFSGVDFRPLPLSERLICVSISEYESFRQYARRADRHDADWFRGYYSSRTNRIAFFDIQTSPKIKEISKKIKQMQTRTTQLQNNIANAKKRGQESGLSGLRTQLNQLNRLIAREKIKSEHVSGLSNISHTIHEASHQLAYNTGIQKRGVTYPLWFSEGIATSFETITPAVLFGPGHDNRGRRRVLTQDILQKRMIPMAQFVAMRTPPAEDDKKLANAYAQSWGLFNYLYVNRLSQLRQYIMFKRRQKPGQRSTKQLKEEFEKHFGPAEQIEKQMIAYIRQISKR